MSPSFTSGNPVNGTVGVPYVFRVSAAGQPSPLFRVSFGTLPAGLRLNADDGIIDGTPTSSGTSPFTITAYNASGEISAEYSITIAPRAADPTPTPTPTTSAPQAGGGPAAGGGSAPAASGGTGTNGRLPNTGLSVGPLAAGGMVALALGIGAIVITIARKTRRQND